MCFGLADVITDGITYARMDGNVAFPDDGYKAAYATVLSFGVVTTVLSLAYHFRNARLMRASVLELSEQGRTASHSLARRQAQQNEWELAQTHRTKVILSLALLSTVAQGACDARGSRGVDCDA